MTITIDKCIGCMYYTKINTYTTSTSTSLDDLVDKNRDEYYTCSKPYLVKCPRESGCIVEKSSISAIAKRCAICGNNIKFIRNSDEIICDECKEAIKKVKELLKNTTTTSASTSDEPLIVEVKTPDEFIIYNEKGE